MMDKHVSSINDDGVENHSLKSEEDRVRNPTTEKGTTDYLESWRLGLVISSLCLGTFLVALDINIIGVAVPKITSVFNSLEDASWYATAYLLPVTALQPTMGYLYKAFSVRTIYFGNVLIFEGGSILCAAAPSSLAFILGRALAGIGAAGLLQGSLAIVTNVVVLQKRPLFMGIVISVFGISVCIGPVMGGAFVDKVTWRWCFWINLPIGGLAILMLILFLRLRNDGNELRKLSVKTKLAQMDYVGTVTFLGATVSLILALQMGGQTKPWSSPTIIGLFVTFGVLIIVFVASQIWGGDNALIPPRVLKQRSVLVGSIFLFFIGMFNYTYSFYLPFYFQAAQDVSPVASGVRIIPFVLTTMVFIGVTGAIVTQYGHYVPYMIAGSVVCIVGTGLITRFDISTPTAQWASFLVIAGAGLGMAQQLPYTAAQIVLSDTDISTGNALFVFFQQLGGIIALPIAQSLFLSSLRSHITSSPALRSIDAADVIATGAANLRLIAHSSDTVLLALRQAYAASLRPTYILGLAAICAAGVCAPWMEWRNLKVEVERRKKLEGEKSESGKEGDEESTL